MNVSENPYQAPATESPALDLAGEATQVSRGKRWAGAMIDGLVMVVAVGPLQWASGVFDDYAAYSRDSVRVASWGVVSLLVWLAINGYFLAKRSQSLGKVVVGTKIVTLDGENASFGRIVLRRMLPISVVSLIPVVGPLFGLADSLAIFGRERRCIHDHIANTRVVRA